MEKVIKIQTYKSLRVMLLTQWFDPEPTFKGMVFARELVRQGFEVEVVTGFPNYPGGKIYPGYSIKCLQREVIDKVHVTRLPLYPNHDHSAVKRVLNYLSFAASSLVYGLFIARRADVIYAYHPPLTVGVCASLIRLIRRIPVVYDVQDLWPDTLRATGMIRSSRALSIVAALCVWVYRRVDRVVVLSPGFRRLLIQRGVPDTKIEVIYNWADEAALRAPQGSLPLTFPGKESFRIIFAGNMGKAQALDAVLDAAIILKARARRVCFIMVGGGIEFDRLRNRAEDMQLNNVIFLPAVPMEEIGTVLAAGDALLVHLKNDPLFEVTLPSKTQAYMAVGRPLLMAVKGDAANLISQSGGGVRAEPENPESIAAAAERLEMYSRDEREVMGRKAYTYYCEHFALSVGAARFGAIFRQLSGR